MGAKRSRARAAELARVLNPFAPPPETDRLPPEKIPSVYRHWRIRQLYSICLGYVIYYLVRKNISLAIPSMEHNLGYNKEQLGTILTAGSWTYGISKFANGIAADRSNARTFMAFGLLVCGLTSIAFGFSTSLWVLALWWMLNQWFQGMGFPPCARVLVHWFGIRERGFKWSIWATSQQVGAFCAFILSAYLAKHYEWRAVFIVPGIISVIGFFVILNRLRDTPGSLGLPSPDEYLANSTPGLSREEGQPDAPVQPEAPVEPKAPKESLMSVLVTRVFSNPHIWLVSLANFFIYVLRDSFNNWAPTYLTEAKHLSLMTAGFANSGFEAAGLFGSLAAGWATDRFFAGRRAPVCVAYMLASCLGVWLFSLVPADCPWASAGALLFVGFAVYGPQCLVSLMTADLAGKEAAAASVGLTGVFGYASGIVSGWGTGKIVQEYGWGATFDMMMVCSLIAAALFALCWKSKPRTD